MGGKTVHAAGGILFRSRDDGEREFAIIHRPRYDDWTLPKGKLEPRESVEEGALREVEEETGYRAEIERRVGETSYRARNGSDKRVTYFAMRPIAGEFAPNDEADEIRWVTLSEANQLLSYDHDRYLVAQVAESPPL